MTNLRISGRCYGKMESIDKVVVVINEEKKYTYENYAGLPEVSPYQLKGFEVELAEVF